MAATGDRDRGHVDSEEAAVRAMLPGNHVLLECDGLHVLLGHLQRGTVRIRVHERVSVGAVVGWVGHSGNSNEPHLHVHHTVLPSQDMSR